MPRNITKRTLAVLVVVLFATSVASARFWSHSKAAVKSANVSILNNAKLGNGPQLKAGDYQLKLLKVSPKPELAFYQDGRMVAETSPTLVDAGKKFDNTQIIYNDANKSSQVITEMDLNGWNQKVMFGNSNHGPSRKG